MRTIAVIASLALVAALSLAWARPAGAQTTAWSPGWTKGDYWVVRSPLFQHVPVLGTSEINEVQDGYYFTRFLVKEMVHRPAGSKAVLEIKYRENEAYTFDEMLHSAEIIFDMGTLRVVGARVIGPPGDVAPVNWETEFAPEFRVFEWRYGSSVPPTLPIIVPAFVPTSTAGQFQLASSTLLNPDGPELNMSQVVAATPQGLLVRLWSGVGAVAMDPSAKVDVELLFRPDKPWPDVYRADGSPVATVVEVGHIN